MFSVAGRRYDWTDVLLWAKAWGGWAQFEGSVRLGLACARRADEDAEAAGPEADLVESAANEFRYDRGLLSAEEMEAWLRRSGLTAEDWMASVERAALKRWWLDEAAEILEAYPVADADLEAALWCDGVCSGELMRYARELASRAAVYARLREAAEDLDRAIDPEVRDLLASLPQDVAGTVPELGRVALNERLEHLARLEVSLHRFSAEVVTPRAIRDHIGAKSLEWIRVDCQLLGVPDEERAREAALLVRADGLDLSEVARLARAGVHEKRVYLEDAEPLLRERLLSATKGDLIGPLRVGEEFLLVLVRDKVMPTEADQDIRRRAAGDVLAKGLAREVDARVAWHEPICHDAP